MLKIIRLINIWRVARLYRVAQLKAIEKENTQKQYQEKKIVVKKPEVSQIPSNTSPRPSPRSSDRREKRGSNFGGTGLSSFRRSGTNM